MWSKENHGIRDGGLAERSEIIITIAFLYMKSWGCIGSRITVYFTGLRRDCETETPQGVDWSHL